MIFAAGTLEQSVTRWLATLDRLVPEAEREYLCAEYLVVHRESHIFHGYGDGFTCAGHQVSPAHPDRCEEGRARRNALKSTMDPARTILQPKNNLECGVKILFNQIINQHKPLLTRSGYWSTLHPDGPSFRIFAKQMTNPPSACGLFTKSTIDKSDTTKSVQDDSNRAKTPK